MAEAVVSIALQTLSDLLVQEAKFLSGVTTEVEELEAELRRMQYFIRDADAKQYSNDGIRNWVQDMKNLAYKAEDVIEKYVVIARRRDGGSGLKKILKRFACILNEGQALHEVGSEIAIINERVTKLKSSLETYGIKSLMEGESSNAASEGKRLARQTYPHEVDKHFVGMDDDIKQVTSLLVDEENKHHRIISILAMGGSGKTTLVRKIYNRIRDDIKHGFQAFAWVCITQQCQARPVMEDILKQLLPETKVKKIKEMDDREVVQQLYQVQSTKKCLVVVDDIWKVVDWDSLSKCFPEVDSQSKALLTTRIQDVAEIGSVYELQTLTEAEGWQLLRDIAFPQTNIKETLVDANQFENIGKSMVHNCGYLPLAIVVLGGILIGKHRLDEWESINKEIDSYLMKGKGKGKGIGGQGVVQQVLALSYNDLPYDLKQCFLYFGCFQEDEVINPQRLYSLWLAEGMISSNDRENKETMRDVSERYLGELAHRCVVQVEMNDEWSNFGRFMSCRLHDLMRDYCIIKCKEENFLDVMDMTGAIYPHTFRNACRATMYVKKGTLGESLGIPPEQISNGLRSLQILGSTSYCDETPMIISSVRRFKLLRTLVIKGFNFKGKSLDVLEKLIHLRYLGLTDCYLDRVPSSIVKLSYLKILDFSMTDITENPTFISKMQKLRYLSLPSSYSFLRDIILPNRKFSFGGLYELEILIGMSSKYHDFSGLFKLKNLRILVVEIYKSKTLLQFIHYLNNSGNNLTWAEVTVELCHLYPSHLKKMLTCHNLHVLNIWFGKILKWPQLEDIDCSQLSSSIVELEIVFSEIEEDPMPILERLPNLKTLFFCGFKIIMNGMSCNAGGFPQLVKLSLQHMEIKLKIDEGAMPNLSILEIENCPNLELTIPERLKSLVRQK